MRRFSFTLAAVLAAWSVDAAAQSRPAVLPISAGQATTVSLDGAVRDVVVGDPEIADISVVSDRTLVILGKRPGVTTLLAFGAGGRPLTDRQIVVSEGGGGGAVTVYRGAAASTYACGRQCTRLGAASPGSPP